MVCQYFLTGSKAHFLIQGPLVYVSMAGQPIVILNSKKTVEDLLDRRAAKYSDRPRILVGREYLTRNLDMVLISHTERLVKSTQHTLIFSCLDFIHRWRKMRRASETALGLRMAMNYQYKQAEESVLLAHDLLKKSSDWKFHTHRQISTLHSPQSLPLSVTHTGQHLPISYPSCMIFLLFNHRMILSSRSWTIMSLGRPKPYFLAHTWSMHSLFSIIFRMYSHIGDERLERTSRRLQTSLKKCFLRSKTSR